MNNNMKNELLRKINIRKQIIQDMDMQNTQHFNEEEKIFIKLNENIKDSELSSIGTKYHQITGNGIKVFVKRIIRKVTHIFWGWYIEDILKQQNFFNGKILNSITELRDITIQESRKRLLENDDLLNKYKNLEAIYETLNDEFNNKNVAITEKILLLANNTTTIKTSFDDKISILDSQNEALKTKIKNDIQIQNDKIKLLTSQNEALESSIINKISVIDNRIDQFSEDLQRDILEERVNKINDILDNIYYEIQKKEKKLLLGNKNYNRIIDNINTNELNFLVNQFGNLSNKNNSSLLNDISECYKKEIQKQWNNLKQNTEVIVVFCLRFKYEFGLEAIKNEAYDTWYKLKQEDNYIVKLVSLEKVVINYDIDSDIIYVDENNVQKCMEELSPRLIVLFESTPYNVLGLRGIFIKYHTLLRISAQNPLQTFSSNTLEELRHCNDYGIHKYIVESKNALNIMKQNGFYNIDFAYPIINQNRLNIQSKNIKGNKFILGFASSPMEENQIQDRGIELIEYAVNHLSDFQFLILWRNKEVTIPTTLIKNKNCKIIYGKHDMNLFFSEIDVLLVPYKSINNNHACSLSGIEAMLHNIPVISTKVAGISELILKTGLGIVSTTIPEDFTSSIQSVINEYDNYIGKDKIVLLKNIIETNNLTQHINDSITDYHAKEFVTLEEWDYILKQNNKYLVKGHKNIKNYYQHKEIANSYNADRFLTFPANCIDKMERVSIQMVLQEFNRKHEIKILDIASGDGRIVQEIISYGQCTSLDSSSEMLQLIKKRFNNYDNLETRLCDYISDSFVGKYDVITTFRYIRHFSSEQRMILYEKIKENLRDKGLLICDIPNIRYAMEDRKVNGWNQYNIYDAFWTEKTIFREMAEANFEIQILIPIGLQILGKEPISWTMVAMKK